MSILTRMIRLCKADIHGVMDEMENKELMLKQHLRDMEEALEAKKSPWEVWFERLCDFYDKRFSGTDWREKEKEFWQNKIRKKF